MKVKKKFKYDDIELRIVEREELYMNSGSTVRMTRVMAPNGGTVPIQIQRKQTLKSIAEETIRILNGFKERGADIKKELTKKL